MKSLDQPVEFRSVAFREMSTPVFRISPSGKILYANKAATGLLKEWNCMASEKLPDQLTSEYPLLLNLWSDEELAIPVSGGTCRCAVIGFPDADYIGIYVHHLTAYTDPTAVDERIMASV